MSNLDILIKTNDGIYRVDSVYVATAMFSSNRICLYGICENHESFEICTFKEGDSLTAEEAARKVLNTIWSKIEANPSGVILINVSEILSDAYDD